MVMKKKIMITISKDIFMLYRKEWHLLDLISIKFELFEHCTDGFLYVKLLQKEYPNTFSLFTHPDKSVSNIFHFK